MDKLSIKGKRRARKLMVQAMYQWQVAKHELAEIETQFRVANNMANVDQDYFCRLLYGIPEKLEQLEQSFSIYLDRPIADLNPVELTILRISTFELQFCPEIPYRVVLDEAVSLAKQFGSQDGHRYVNGVLHQVAQQSRSVEINA